MAELDILVVDDNPEVLAMFREILGMEGHQVRVFDNGTSAVADFRRQSADLIITDLGMPEVSGWEVARQVRRITAKTPIVFITAVGERVDQDIVDQLGVTAVLRKPFKLSQIKDILMQLG
jgi:CheY-like chemotaxis protein